MEGHTINPVRRTKHTGRVFTQRPQFIPMGYYHPDLTRRSTKKKSSPYTAIICLFVFLGVAACVGIPLGIVYGKKSKTTSTTDAKPSVSSCNTVKFSSTLTFSEMDFNDELYDKTSERFNQFSQKFCTDLSAGLTDRDSFNECGATNDLCDVISYSPGSVKVKFAIRINLLKSEEEIKEMQKDLETNLTRAIENSVTAGKNGPDEENVFKNPVEDLNVVSSDFSPLVQCPNLYIPSNSFLVTGSIGARSVGTNLVVRCNPGFRVNGDEKDQVFLCETDGQWSNTVQECKALQCPAVTNMENRLLVSGNLTHSKYKDSVITNCKEGYSLDINDPEDKINK